jgi:hypothetical protein
MHISAAHAFYCLVHHTLMWDDARQTFATRDSYGRIRGEVNGYPALEVRNEDKSITVYMEFADGRTVSAIGSSPVWSAWINEPTDIERIVIRFLCDERNAANDPNFTNFVDWAA